MQGWWSGNSNSFLSNCEKEEEGERKKRTRMIGGEGKEEREEAEKEEREEGEDNANVRMTCVRITRVSLLV